MKLVIEMKKKDRIKIATVQYTVDAREFRSLKEAFDHIRNKIYNDANYYGADIVEVRSIIVWYTLYKNNKWEVQGDGYF